MNLSKQNNITYDLDVNFDNKPAIQQLICENCLTKFAGVWRNDFVVRECKYCGADNVKPIVRDSFAEIEINLN